MFQIRQFRSGEQIRARVDLPLRKPDSNFGTCVQRGTRGQFRYYQQRKDGGCLAVVLFQNPHYSASFLVYSAFPVQIERA